MIEVIILSPEAPVFEGKAQRVIFPGEQGVFEIGPFHRPLMSRLISGVVIVDDQRLPIRRGVVKVWQNKAFAIVEPSSVPS